MSNTEADKKLIKGLGGVPGVLAHLGWGPDQYTRVCNWIHRGIPAAVKVQRPDLFMPQQDEPQPKKRAAKVAA